MLRRTYPWMLGKKIWTQRTTIGTTHNQQSDACSAIRVCRYGFECTVLSVLLWVITSGTRGTLLTSLPPWLLQGKMTLSRDELGRPLKFTVRPQQWIGTTDTTSRRSTGMFCHVVFTILNHVTKHPTPSLDKDSATESKACGLVKFWILRKKPCFVLTSYDRINQTFFH